MHENIVVDIGKVCYIYGVGTIEQKAALPFFLEGITALRTKERRAMQ